MMLNSATVRSRNLEGTSSRVRLRVAEPRDGEEIGRLIQTDWKIDGVDWSKCGANWLVAEFGGEVCGCIEILPGHPFGRVEFLGLSDALPQRHRARVARALLRQGIATLKVFGCAAVSSIIPRELESYRVILGRRGCVSIGDGEIVMRRL
jgi:hypothetical protein